ncbi:HAD-IA family hydrolase [Catenovulum agarivorans]|uniref:HAD-IA family hydrolase n=1 Tax=Catenovulum agarivorans TaxID=1172192 RepID=UPI0002E08812|nr:HAD-IA family hydrolase [Catenovulum agarivorans]
MQIYRRISNIQVISFDLDDTLYDNVPIIQQAENKLLQFVNRKLAQVQVQPLTEAEWMSAKHSFATEHRSLAHDVTALRQAFLRHLFSNYKLAGATAVAEQAYQLFFQYRNNFTVDKQVVTWLEQLKTRYKLVAITNGNADPQLIGLTGIFEHVLRPKTGLKMKPASDLFAQASQLMHIKPQHILHVGDSEFTDVAGAVKSGCKAVWFDADGRHYKGQVLPDMVISSVEELYLYLGE